MTCLESTLANLCTLGSFIVGCIVMPVGWEEWASAVQIVGAGLGSILYAHLLLRRVLRWWRLRKRRSK